MQYNFRTQSLYTPLVDWTAELQNTRSRYGGLVTELIEGETDFDELPLSTTNLDAMGVDSRSRTFTSAYYAGLVRLNRHDNLFNQWKLSGGSDWKPLLRGLLGRDVLNKHEMLSRNIFLRGPKDRWTYAGAATDWATIGANDTFKLETVIDWNFRMGNIGSPVIPGDTAAAKVCIIPPGVEYALRTSLSLAATNEAQMWRDARLYSGQPLNFEIGEFSGVRFQKAQSDRFGINPAVLYNCGAIAKQFGVTTAIKMGDGAPDPTTTLVDEVWSIGQKNSTHYIQLENFAAGEFVVNDVVTIHNVRTSAYGVTNGVDPLAGRTIQRRVVVVDAVNNRLSFDRPILFDYNVPITGASVTGATAGTFYAWVTRGRNIAMCLTLGSRGGVLGAVVEPLEFHEPVAIDVLQKMWAFAYDMVLGYNVWDPNVFEVHFCAVHIPKPGGVTVP